MAIALVVAYLLTGARETGSAAFRAGSADSERILASEPWRAVTALTLHADVAHLIANVTAGALLATAVCRTVGGGLGAALIVAAGAGGNVLNAYLQGPSHVSIGASTAVLGAVGLLSGLAFVRTRHAVRGRGRAWLPLAAGLALLGMLGSDPRTDLGAHLCGFVVGVVLGAITGRTIGVPGRGVQRVLAVAAAIAVAASWWLALGAA
jgi:rhomboid protease GluP